MSEPKASLPDLVHTVSRGLRRSWMQSLTPHGITPHEWRALHIVVGHLGESEDTEASPLRQRDVAEALRIAPRSAAEVVTRLVELGYVIRGPHPDDKRAVVVTATDSGRKVESEVRQLRDDAGAEYFASLPPQDAQELTRILSSLVAEHPAPRRAAQRHT